MFQNRQPSQTDSISLASLKDRSSSNPWQPPEGGYSNYDHGPSNDSHYNPLITSDGSSGSLGLGEKHPFLHWQDGLALLISFICCGLASAVVADDRLAWLLGYDYQLVVIGFLLAIMAFCTANVAPGFFLRCEARFGHSILQNYEAIKVNTPWAGSMSWSWRIVLALLMALPLGLSAAYKLFSGGEAWTNVNPTDSRFSDDWGMYPPPGILPLGWNTGLTAFYNASLPFMQASTNSTSRTDPDYDSIENDLPLPTQLPQVYGFNTILLNNSAAAMLDGPPPDWIQRVQKDLRDSETLQVTANVLGTVAAYNATVDDHRDPQDPWWSIYGNATGDPNRLFSGWHIWCSYNPQRDTNNDASWFFISLFHEETMNFWQEAKFFNTARKNCSGTWSVTPGAVTLTNGTCDDSLSSDVLKDTSQQIFVNNRLDINQFYNPVFTEYLAPFQTRIRSQWLMPTMAVTLASTYWSRVAAMSGPSSPHWLGNDRYRFNPVNSSEPLTVSNANLQYRSNTVITLRRPAIVKAPLLYLVLIVQPLLTLSFVLANILLNSVPVGQGFGLTAIMAGAKQETLGLLKGAGFSGSLRRPLHVGISVTEMGDRQGTLSYALGVRRIPLEGRMRRDYTYY